MSLYVVSANQELLWNVISKNSYIQTFFSQYNPDTKVDWFKSIVSKFYDQYRNQKLTVNELNRVNKETISYMIQNIREQTTTQSNPTSPINDTPNVQAVNSYAINTPPVVTNNRQEIYANQFEQRQNEYAAMNKRNVPDDVNFAEKNDVQYVNHTFTSHLQLSASLQPYAESLKSIYAEFPQQLKSLAWDLTENHIEIDKNGYINLPSDIFCMY